MIHNTKELCGHKLSATDGDIGRVKDFYFDDQSWAVRYVVADTGTWLSGREVLLAPRCFGPLNPTEQQFSVKLTRKQIEDSPAIDTHLPVSRQIELEYYRHYGWNGYWETEAFRGMANVAPPLPPEAAESRPHHGHNQREDLHLRSVNALTGYAIEAKDGTLGKVNDFLVDTQSWLVRQIAVETGHWYSGKEILILPSEVTRISFDESKVFVNLTKADLEHTKEHQVAKAT